MLAKLIKNKYLLIIITAWLTGLVCHSVMAMNSANFEINGDILDGGGANGSASANYILTDSIGEPVAGRHDAGGNSDLESGFLDENNNVILTSATSSESFINAVNNTAFNIQCVGVTDNEADQTITCEGSFDQSNWYTINTQASPVDNITISGSPDISGWTGYPSDGATTIYARAHDGYNVSYARSFAITKDTGAPTTTASVFSGTLGTNNWYTTDVDMTTTPIDATSGVANTNYCVDQTDTCVPATNYTVPVTISTEGTNYFRYFSIDNAGNTQTVQSEEIKIDKTSPTTAPTCSPASNTYFKDNLSITCTTGTGGTSIRYTDDNSEPDQSSPVWSDQIIATSSNFKFISCDEANNCYSTSSNYDYNLDNTPPPIPVMNTEPIYTMDLDNTVSATAVVDGGAGGVSYEFCINETDTTTGCTESEWVNDPAYNFSELHDAQIYYYFVRSKDSLDNISDWSSSVFSTQNNETGNYYYYLENDTTANAITNDNLIAWWDYEETDGSIAYDRSGLENNGEYFGTNSTAGQLFLARLFNGSSDYINLGKNLSARGQSRRTMSAWINVNTLTNQNTIFYESNDTHWYTRLNLYIWTDGSVQMSGRDSDGSTVAKNFATTNANEIQINQWYHIVGVYDADTDNHKIYINGVDKTTSSIASTAFPDTAPFDDMKIGNDIETISNNYFSGAIDEAKIFNRALTSSEANNEYLKRITDNPYIDNHSYTEGIHYFHVRPRSNSYLWGTERIYEIDYDNTAPTINSISSVAGDTLAPYYDTTDNSDTLVIFTSSDNLTGVTECKWSETDETFAAMPNTCTDTSHCTLNLAGEGPKTVYFRCIDGINNEAATSYILNYTIDSGLPGVLSITSVAGDTVAPYKDNTDNADTALVYTSSIDAVACRWSTTDQNYESMSDTCIDTSNCVLNLTGDGDKTVYMRCIDSGGLTSASSYVLNYTIDTTPPIINSITSVAGDTLPTYYDTTNDSATQILFDVSTDAIECKWSATDQDYDSMSNVCNAPGDCTANLPGQGAKTVYLRCKDDIENKMTSSTQVDYIVDSIAPNVLSITSVANDFIPPYLDRTTPYGQSLVVYTASSDAQNCKWDYSDVSYDAMLHTCTNTTNCTITHTDDGQKDVFFRCQDEAGNTSPNSYELNFEVDEVSGGGGMKVTESSSRPDDQTNLIITLTPDLTTPAVNGSIRINLAEDYNLSTLTYSDISASGGDVTWTDNELIYPDNNIIIFPFTGSLSNEDGQITLIINNLQTRNPGSIGTYFVTYNIFNNPSGIGASVEEGDGAISINNEVVVTATVPSYLGFDILPVSTGEIVNGSTINVATNSSDNIDFGTLFGSENKIAAHDLRVSTNATGGYGITIEFDNSMAGAGGNFITDFIGTNQNPLSWLTPPGSGVYSYFGYTTSEDNLSVSPYDRFTGNKWSGPERFPHEIAHFNDPSLDRITRIGYQLEITELQPADVYSTNVSYICTPTYQLFWGNF